MGYSLYAHCYVSRDAANKEDALVVIRAMAGVSLIVPDAEPIQTRINDILHLVERIPRYEPIAVCKSKVGFSLHPRLALIVFISKMSSLAKRLGPHGLVVVHDEDQELGSVATISTSFKIFLVALAIVEAPLWLVLWLMHVARRG